MIKRMIQDLRCAAVSLGQCPLILQKNVVSSSSRVMHSQKNNKYGIKGAFIQVKCGQLVAGQKSW
jgi:hypothetical protein